MRKKKSKEDEGESFDHLQWSKVETPESFLTGLQESGFFGLEEVEIPAAGSSASVMKEKRAPMRKRQKTEEEEEKEEQEEEEEEEEDYDADDDDDEEEKRGEDASSVLKGVDMEPGEDEPEDRLRHFSQQSKKRQREKEQKTKEEGEEAEEEEPKEELPDNWTVMRMHPKALSGIRNLGFAEPTEIQRRAIPAVIIAGKDVIGASETGSGKTLAFAVPIVHRLLERREKLELKGHEAGPMLALILTPTRELAMQVVQHIKAFAGHTGIRVAPIVGGMSSAKQERVLLQGPEIVVATTGRLWELISLHGNEFLSDFRSLEFFVLDEADRMIETGHFKELDGITALVRQQQQQQQQQQPEEGEEDGDGGGRQQQQKLKLHTLVFSATLAVTQTKPWEKKKGETKTPLDKVLEKLDFKRKVEVIDLTRDSVTVGTLTEFRLKCLDDEKDANLLRFLLAHRPGRVVVFANAISMVRRLVALLRRLRVCAARLHSGMQQRQRLKAIDHFRSHDTCVLVASDVAARGLDIPEIAYVVHYNVPKTADLYVHRSGRTARAGHTGLAITFVGPSEARCFADICKKLGKNIPALPATHKAEGSPDPPTMAQLRPVVNTARALERELRLAASDAAKRRWLRSVAEKLDIDIATSDSEGISDDDDNDGDGEHGRPARDSDDEADKRKQMNEWQRRVAEMKERLAGQLCEIDVTGAPQPRRRGFGKRPVPSGEGMTQDKLARAIEEAREKNRQLAIVRRKSAKAGVREKAAPKGPRAKRKNLKKFHKRR